jgi:hypothetical protein
MRVKQLWVIAVGCSLLSAPAWAHSSQGGDSDGKRKDERRDSSIRLTSTTKRDEMSVLSQRVGEGYSALSKWLSHGDDKRALKSHSSVGGLPPGLEKKIRGIRGNGKDWRGSRGQSTPSIAGVTTLGIDGVTPIPEPSALWFFGVGLVVARRAIGRTWR